jgi:hypothetical protein
MEDILADSEKVNPRPRLSPVLTNRGYKTPSPVESFLDGGGRRCRCSYRRGPNEMITLNALRVLKAAGRL